MLSLNDAEYRWLLEVSGVLLAHDLHHRVDLWETFLAAPQTPRCALVCQTIERWQTTLDFWCVSEADYPVQYLRLLLPTDFSGTRRRSSPRRPPRPYHRSARNRRRAVQRALQLLGGTHPFLQRMLDMLSSPKMSVLGRRVRRHDDFFGCWSGSTWTAAGKDRAFVMLEHMLRVDDVRWVALHVQHALFEHETTTLMRLAVMYDAVECLRELCGDRRIADRREGGSDLESKLQGAVDTLAVQVRDLMLYQYLDGDRSCTLAARFQSVRCLRFLESTGRNVHQFDMAAAVLGVAATTNILQAPFLAYCHERFGGADAVDAFLAKTWQTQLPKWRRYYRRWHFLCLDIDDHRENDEENDEANERRGQQQ